MRITVLGSGTVDPRPERASTGFFLQCEEHSALLDLGAGALHNALRFGCPVASVSTVILTHHHPDHTSDLVPFLFARKYAPGPWRASPRLTIVGPLGTRRFLEAILAAWPALRSESEVEVQEVSPGQHWPLPGGWRAEAWKANHGDMEALSWRLQSHDRVVAFSGDTALCPGVVAAARKADLFFCECACFPRGVEPVGCRTVHLCWEDVADICREAQPARVVLTHLYEAVLQRGPDPRGCLEEALSLPVELADDGSVYQLGDR